MQLKTLLKLVLRLKYRWFSISKYDFFWMFIKCIQYAINNEEKGKKCSIKIAKIDNHRIILKLLKMDFSKNVYTRGSGKQHWIWITGDQCKYLSILCFQFAMHFIFSLCLYFLLWVI